MLRRSADGSAGDADYGNLGRSYSSYRRPDPRIARVILEALGPAKIVLNVGAGAGSYEPVDREVTPVEPSASMRAQQPRTLPPAIDATAEDLPFPDDSFDAAKASALQRSTGAPSLTEQIPGCRFAARCPMAEDRCKTSAIELTPVGRNHVARCIRTDEFSDRYLASTWEVM